MKLSRLFNSLLLCVCLSNCAQSVKPYSEKREAARVEVRDQEQTIGQIVFEEGRVAGESDRTIGDPDNYRRHSPMYTPGTEKAYADGYREGYHPAGSSKDGEIEKANIR